MLHRYSVVNRIILDTLSFSSVLEIGDSNNIRSSSKVYAVQREQELFYGSEGNFNDPIFTEPIPLPPLVFDVAIQKINERPNIVVNCIDITGVSSASVVQIGQTCDAYSEARVKNIRHLQNGENS
ncbi:spore germination protein PE [Bacillus pakistanensis]|uniref:Spore germination protein PE n=1 Tax=Rossellomorea pakistanensis TaxID=992288 RepID=A0ABS2NFC9_9BACI|nr:spore germination protein GerPE [Bacillus pakistanensis]MBM7586474.1 spore germination protein PE [Bacillus pakistanensis]